MITKQQALTEQHFHCEAVRRCVKTIGPRGGVEISVVNVRASGSCQTWKTRPDDFKLPVKFGLYASTYITQDNAGSFHLPKDCATN